jgi:hypothetical protein
VAPQFNCHSMAAWRVLSSRCHRFFSPKINLPESENTKARAHHMCTRAQHTHFQLCKIRRAKCLNASSWNNLQRELWRTVCITSPHFNIILPLKYNFLLILNIKAHLQCVRVLISTLLLSKLHSGKIFIFILAIFTTYAMRRSLQISCTPNLINFSCTISFQLNLLRS